MCVSLKVAFLNLLLSNRFSFLTRIDVSFYILAFNTQKIIYERSTHYFIDWRDSTIPLHCHPYSYPILVLSLFIPLLSVNIWFHRTSNRTKQKNWLIFSFMNIFKNWLYSSIESRFFSLVFLFVPFFYIPFSLSERHLWTRLWSFPFFCPLWLLKIRLVCFFISFFWSFFVF